MNMILLLILVSFEKKVVLVDTSW